MSQLNDAERRLTDLARQVKFLEDLWNNTQKGGAPVSQGSSSSPSKIGSWTQPSEAQGEFKGLYVRNSLVHDASAKTKFVPQQGNRVTWYICGPTVYDSSHFGHARNYVTFDIIRRILEDYFNYDVFSVMNITDVDDKIILKARRSYLFDEYLKSTSSFSAQLSEDLVSSWQTLIKGHEDNIAKLSEDKYPSREKAAELKLLTEKRDAAKKDLATVQNALKKGKDLPADQVKAIIELSKDPLSVLLDKRGGSNITDMSIFRQTASIYEREFLEDMKALGVRPPDVLTRVTEYIPNVVTFVTKVIENKFAYESNGSVYFDTKQFTQTHEYGKLEPWSIGNEKLTDEGEGSLTDKGAKSEKRSPSDFALWKKSKPGEPYWESPWGLGRPGWHIECSAMASDLLGEVMDIHSGGEDLRFPHHDNELAQSEAYFANHQWVNYFLHSGHLHIDGLKMSKSLKNFITIRQALTNFSARQIRLLFLIRGWDKVINYAEDAMKEVKAKEKTIVEFFLTAKNIIRDGVTDQNIVDQKWGEAEKSLHSKLLATQTAVDVALKNNFDTQAAVEHLLDLINETNTYFKRDVPSQRVFLLRRVAAFVTKILKVFGLIPHDEIGFSSGGDGVSRDEIVLPFCDVLSSFRTQVRKTAMEKKIPELLLATDRLRDELCPPLGLRLEDDSNTYKLADPKELLLQIKQTKETQDKDKLGKLQAKLLKARSDLQKFEASSIPPEQALKEEYIFDEKGNPTHTKPDGKEISKGALKKFPAEKEKKEKAHQEYQKKIKEDPNYATNLKKVIQTLEQEAAELSAKLGQTEKKK